MYYVSRGQRTLSGGHSLLLPRETRGQPQIIRLEDRPLYPISHSATHTPSIFRSPVIKSSRPQVQERYNFYFYELQGGKKNHSQPQPRNQETEFKS